MLVKKRKKKATKCSVDSLVIKIQKHQKTFISKQTQTQRERVVAVFFTDSISIKKKPTSRRGSYNLQHPFFKSKSHPFTYFTPKFKSAREFYKKGF